MRALLAVVVVLVAATAAAAPLPTYPPEGWRHDSELDAKGPVPMLAFRAPAGDAFYAIAGIDDASGSVTDASTHLAERLLAWLDAHPRSGRFTLSPDYRQHIFDEVVEANDGRRVHVRVIAGLVDERVEMRAVICAAREPADIAACDASLAMLSMPVAARPEPFNYTRLYWLGGSIGGGLVALALGALWWRRARRSRDLAHSAPLTDGELVTITGTVRAVDATLSAALSGKKCVLYRAHARVYSRDPVPRLLAEPFELETVAFTVETPRGVVRVDERAPAVAVTAEAVVDDGQARVGEWLAKHRVAEQLRAGASLDEIVVEAGQTVTLRGMIRLERDDASTAERGYREDAPVTPMLVAAGEEPVTLLRMW